MQTEFTCGIYTVFDKGHTWELTVHRHVIGYIYPDGSIIQFNPDCNPLLSTDDLTELSVLMNNIKRQYKQLQTT